VIYELLDSTRSIKGVFRPAVAGSVQEPNIEVAADGWRIIKRQVFDDVALRKAPAMNGGLEIVDCYRFRLPAREEMNVVGELQA
jgi:hypothetical protein